MPRTSTAPEDYKCHNLNMLSSVGSKDLCPRSPQLNQGHTISDTLTNTSGVASSPSLQKNNETFKHSETRRKIVSKKVLKQARFTYKSKHLSTSSHPTSLIFQLDNLSLENGNSNKPILPDTNTIKVSLPNTTSCPVLAQPHNVMPSSSDCCGNFTLMNLNSNNGLPSFNSIKQNSNEKKVSNNLPFNNLSLDEQRNLKRASNRKSFTRRRKEKMRSQSLPDKMGSTHRHPTLVPSPFVSTTTTCAHEAHLSETNAAVCEISAYMENYFVLPKKMSSMAEMMYT